MEASFASATANMSDSTSFLEFHIYMYAFDRPSINCNAECSNLIALTGGVSIFVMSSLRFGVVWQFVVFRISCPRNVTWRIEILLYQEWVRQIYKSLHRRKPSHFIGSVLFQDVIFEEC
jgi:hypothetical protein